MNINELTKASARPPLDFNRINRAALANLPVILHRWLPGGTIKRGEFTACNPRRADRRPGSFSINIRSGKWSDFATEDRGNTPLSLAIYLSGLQPYEAALQLANMLNIDPIGNSI